MADTSQPKPLFWIASTRDDLREFPNEVRQIIGYGLYLAQMGDKHLNAKALKGFGGAGTLEIVADHDGDTYRAVYTVRYREVVYVLHVFAKKSKSGKATPKTDLDLIKRRVKLAEQEYQRWRGSDANR